MTHNDVKYAICNQNGYPYSKGVTHKKSAEDAEKNKKPFGYNGNDVFNRQQCEGLI